MGMFCTYQSAVENSNGYDASFFFKPLFSVPGNYQAFMIRSVVRTLINYVAMKDMRWHGRPPNDTLLS